MELQIGKRSSGDIGCCEKLAFLQALLLAPPLAHFRKGEIHVGIVDVSGKTLAGEVVMALIARNMNVFNAPALAADIQSIV